MEEAKKVLLHIRWPLQSFVLLGFLFGMVVSRAALSLSLVMGFISWFLLCAGLTVFNSYYDKDKGHVVGLAKPPRATKPLLYGSLLLKLAGLAIALPLGGIFLGIYILVVALSVLYSHKRFRFKSSGYMAVMFNFILGLLTFLAATSFGFPRIAILAAGSIAAGAFLASVYLLTQIHQEREDKARGDVSVTVRHGKKAAVASSIALMFIAAVLAIASLAMSGLHPAFVLVFAAYFAALMAAIYSLMRKKRYDYKFMNRLALWSSYAANAALLAIYVLQVKALI